MTDTEGEGARKKRPIRAYWRMVRVSCRLVWETAKLAFLVQFIKEPLRPAYRAERQRRACGKFCRRVGVRVTQVGEVPKEGAHLVVANHLGLIDPWIVASKVPVAIAAKAEMATWPIMGWVCRTIGIIFVERDRRMATSKFVEDIKRTAASGIGVLVFPEGTTGDGRSIRRFKTGAFASVAGTEGVDVLPVYHNAVRINGEPSTPDTRQILGWVPNQPMVESAFGWLSLRSIEIELRIGEPIPAAGKDRKELARLSQEAVERLAGDLVETKELA